DLQAEEVLSGELHPETLCVDAGAGRAEPGEPAIEAVYLSTTYRQGGDHEYIRDGTASTEAFERAVGALSGGHAAAFASGMAASAAVLDGLAPGSRVVAPNVAYAGVRTLMRERADSGVLEVEFVDQTDTDATIAPLDGAALLWAESPNNPLIQITDLAALAAAAHERDIPLAVDATLATPLLQDTIGLGADFVVNS